MTRAAGSPRLPFALMMLVGLACQTIFGIGILGNNSTVVWGFDIANYVWWIGIGNAGTLISALLLLTRQRWRASINRFAEAMTLFAASIAGLFPIFHLGRPMFFYWLAPYPNPMGLWPQWRSALTWDFWAITSYILFSFMFWYTGLIPDLATLRDRASRPLTRRLYGVFALGWRNSARHWRLQQTLMRTMAALAVPLVCSVHSIVGLDFAASIEPGWEESLFPPYFVVGAMFSGFAMVVLLATLIRSGLGLKALITLRHFDAMAKIILAGAMIMGLSYATEWFMAWYGGERAERTYLSFAFTGTYAPIFMAMLLFNVLLPQVLWLKAARRHVRQRSCNGSWTPGAAGASPTLRNPMPPRRQSFAARPGASVTPWGRSLRSSATSAATSSATATVLLLGWRAMLSRTAG